MKTNIKIRFATSADIPLIFEFIKQLAEFERLLDKVIATEETLKNQLFGKSPAAEVILAYIDDIPVGFALFFKNFSTFLAKPGIYLEDLYVKPEFRSNGIARKLLTFLAQLAIKRDYGRLEWSVLNWNQKAIDFYLSLGAIPMDEWTVYRVTGSKLEDLATHNI